MDIFKYLKIKKLSYKIGGLIIATEVIALVILGAVFIARFSNQIDSSVEQKLLTPGYLMSKGLLRYETTEDQTTMESLIGESLDECMIIGNNQKIYFSLNPTYRGQESLSVDLVNQFADQFANKYDPVFIQTEINGVPSIISINPIYQDGEKHLGFLFIKAKVELLQKQKRSISLLFIIGILLCILLTTAIILYVFDKFFSTNIEKVVGAIRKMSLGETVQQLDVHTIDEIGEITDSINHLIEGFQHRITFANEIAKGNLDAEFEKLSDNDVMGVALLNMRASLQKAQQEEIVRQEEVKVQNWTSQGVAHFAGLLRQNNDNIIALSYNIIKNLSDFINANQGAIFLLNDNNPDDPYFEIAAAMAYDRQKLIEAKFRVGEGLVGRAVHEKLTIYLTKLPKNYISITSGLGDAPPSSLLLVPLIHDNIVLGVIELASFEQFKPHEIHFVELVAESIAATLLNVRINARTEQLLQESMKQKEELAAQEEEMRQNLEELAATQEEAARKQHEMTHLWSAIANNNIMAVFDTEGYLIECNQQYTDLVNIASVNQALGQNFSETEAVNWPDSDLDSTWNQIKTGKIKKHIVKKGIQQIVLSYLPVKDDMGRLVKVVCIGIN